jgi:transcriptional regulator GlxA family with amidase domain
MRMTCNANDISRCSSNERYRSWATRSPSPPREPELELSGGFFCRAFHAAVSKAPHDYIIDRRISRARTLLRDRSLGLSAVAHASGFSSHAHMTATFRKRLGVAPGELRETFD